MCLHTQRVSEHMLVGLAKKLKFLEIRSFSFRENCQLLNNNLEDIQVTPVLCTDTLRVCRHKTKT